MCQVTYTVNSDWGTGFSVAVNITNNGPAITSWTLGYAYTGNQKIAQGWSGNWSQSGENITVTNASWNGTLATGGSPPIGANFSYTGTNTAPTAFTLNGTTCNGTGSPSPTPSPTPTSPSPSPTPTSPSPSPSPTSTGGGGSGTPMVSITSPTAGQIFTPGSTVTLQASPGDRGGHDHLGHLLRQHQPRRTTT